MTERSKSAAVIDEPTTWSAIHLLLALLFLGLAIDYKAWSTPGPISFFELGLAVIFMSCALFAPSQKPAPRLWFSRLLWAVTIFQLCLAAFRTVDTLRVANHPLIPLLLLANVSVVLLLLAEIKQRWVFGAVVAIYLLIGWGIVSVWPAPRIDVWEFQNDAVKELLNGHNPYSMTFPNIYGNLGFYGPGIADNNRVYVGFTYPPINLLFDLLGYVVGDLRYGFIFATVATAWMISRLGSRRASIVALLFLTTPALPFLLTFAWTEPVVVCALAAVAACLRFPRLLPYALGALLSTKQYMFWALPPALLLMPRPWLSSVGKMLAVALLINGPFMLWDFHSFFYDLVTFQLKLSWRADALSIFTKIIPIDAWQGFMASSFVIALAVVAGGVYALRRRAEPSLLFALMALTFTVFFATSKAAFPNYYLLPVGALAIALALPRKVMDNSRR